MNTNKPRKSNLKGGTRNGRPPKDESERQSVFRQTRYTPEESKILEANVRRCGFKTVSEYIRKVTLNPRIVPRLTETEMTIARNLSGMSNNFNQIVRLCHRDGLSAMTKELEYYLGKFRLLFAKFNTD